MQFYKKLFLDCLFYLILPLVIWHYTRIPVGNYGGILLSTAPSVLYAVITFFQERQFSSSGFFILGMVLGGSVLDVSAGSANTILWYRVYYNYGMIAAWLFTIVIRRPMALYFFIDYAYYRGLSKEEGRALFTTKEALPYFYGLTILFLVKDLCDIPIKILLIKQFGSNGYHHYLLITTLFGWIFNGIKALAVVYVVHKLSALTGNPALNFLHKKAA